MCGNNCEKLKRMNKVIIIAEAGVNHNGDINLAKKLIDAAADIGVDYVKFQTWITEELVDKSAEKAEYQIQNDGVETNQFDMLKKLELSFEEFVELKNYAEKIGVGFLSTPDEEKSLDFLADELNLPIIKVGSGEINNVHFLKKIGRKKRKVILSTGMSDLGEVERAFNILKSNGATEVIILHCTSNYPAPLESVNLKAMLTLKEAFKTEVGYSDHTIGNEVSLAAVALGAVVIEKHFTLDKTMDGPDHKASSDVEEFKALVRQIRNIETALSGSGRKEIQQTEISTKSVVRKGIYARDKISKGNVLSYDDLIYKRPIANGIDASLVDSVIGKKVKSDIEKDYLITLNLIE